MTSPQTYDSNFPCGFGKLELNLRSLECCLRIFLDIKDNNKTDPYNYKVGDKVPPCWMSKDCDLAKLINRYNDLVELQDKLEKRKITDLRNALAHGRILSHVENAPMVVLNVKNNILISKDIMDPIWFDKGIKFIYGCVQKVKSMIDQEHSKRDNTLI